MNYKIILSGFTVKMNEFVEATSGKKSLNGVKRKIQLNLNFQKESEIT